MFAPERPFWTLARPAERLAVIAGDGEHWTYAQLGRRADAAARLWRRDAKSLVLLLARNDLPTLAAYVGALRVGDPVLIVDPSTPLAVLAAIVENFRPDAIVHPVDMADPLLDGYDVVTSDLGLAVSAPEEYDVPAPHPDLAVVIAGADPGRFVRLSRRNLVSQARAMASCVALTAESRAVTVLPFASCQGLGVVNAHLQSGAAVLMAEDSVAAARFWAFARSHAPSLLAGSAYELDLLDEMRFVPSHLPTLQTMMFAGGQLKAARLRRIEAAVRPAAVRLTTYTGAAETSGAMAYVPAALIPEKLGALGVAMPGSTLSVDEATGTLHCSGSNVALGHAENRAELARGDVLGGRFACSEVVRMDADGLLWQVASGPPLPIAQPALSHALARP